MALHSDGATLTVGGQFGAVGNVRSSGIAQWGEVCDWTTVCAGDGSAGPCPCGNAGATGAGCANAVDPAGALLAASGTLAPDALALATSGTGASVLTVFFKGSAAVAPAAFGDGLRCAGGVLVRFGVQFAAGGSATFPRAGDPPLSALGATLPGSGLTAVYQAFYRDPASFCTAGTYNATNAIRVVW
jgi:hypothetical protein